MWWNVWERENKKNEQSIENKQFIEDFKKERKQGMLEVEENVPEGVEEFIEIVNLFIEEVEPEDPIEPMICDSSIHLNENELRFLIRGPKFMMKN